MSNEYRRLLKRQFGKKNYAGFVRSVKEGRNTTSIIHKEVYQEIYKSLKSLQPGVLVRKLEQLEEVISYVIRIGKTYSLTVGVYLAAVLILLLYGTVTVFNYAGILLLTAAFLWKTAEYFGNKFCYVDVRIIINYKTALERLIIEAGTQNSEKNSPGTQM